jgi:hypothetical protein
MTLRRLTKSNWANGWPSVTIEGRPRSARDPSVPDDFVIVVNLLRAEFGQRPVFSSTDFSSLAEFTINDKEVVVKEASLQDGNSTLSVATPDFELRDLVFGLLESMSA